jgi:hypothetical protein
MADPDLEYLASVYQRLRCLDRVVRTFRIVTSRGPQNGNGENTNSEAVGSKVRVAEPPGT